MFTELHAPSADQIRMQLQSWETRLQVLSHRLHAEPELAFEEHRSAEQLVAFLAAAGFTIATPVAHLPTSFDATFGDGDLHVAFLAEYDALPQLGHACGHNIIAAASVGAAIALAPYCDALGVTLHVVGTPAEERGGGKQILLDAGAFDPIAVAVMMHPYHANIVAPRSLAIGELLVEFAGRSAHASAAPEKGVNAADAATIAQVAIGLLRQHLEPGQQVHGIVANGGKAPNIIPEYASMEYLARASDAASLDRLVHRMNACFEGAALATSTQLRVREIPYRYDELHSDERLVGICEDAFRSLDRDIARSREPFGSTDMGNLSQLLPSIHPMLKIGDGSFTLHQPEFGAASISASGDAAVLDGAFVLAATVVSAATQPATRQQLLQEHVTRVTPSATLAQ